MLQSFNPRNKNILIYVNGEILPRGSAKISVFDSVVQGGDAVWEGIRVYNGRIFALEKHLSRLMESAHALMFDKVPDKTHIRSALFKTLEANKMKDGVHVRLTLTRGEKVTSGMDPRLNQKGCGLIILAEWKPPVYDNDHGINIITSTIRRNNPNFLDSKIHHNNLLNNILAKIEANVAGADAALMLDQQGFASECNGTNIFMVKGPRLLTPHADSCLPGITRSIVLEIARSLSIEVSEKNISLAELYNADQVFVSGTMGELTPVKSIDRRKIHSSSNSEILQKIREAFYKKIKEEGTRLPF